LIKGPLFPCGRSARSLSGIQSRITGGNKRKREQGNLMGRKGKKNRLGQGTQQSLGGLGQNRRRISQQGIRGSYTEALGFKGPGQFPMSILGGRTSEGQTEERGFSEISLQKPKGSTGVGNTGYHPGLGALSWKCLAHRGTENSRAHSGKDTCVNPNCGIPRTGEAKKESPTPREGSNKKTPPRCADGPTRRLPIVTTVGPV